MWSRRGRIVTRSECFLCISASAADASAVNLKEINTILANGVITFFINSNPVFNKEPSNLLKNSPDCISFDNWVFENLISGDKLFEKALRILETCLSVNYNSCGKLALSLKSPIMLVDNLNTTLVSFFIADFNLFNCEFDHLLYKLLYWVTLYN